QGIVPNVNLAMSAGVEHRWNGTQLCWSPVLDEYGNSSVEGIAIAGDGGGIAGAEAAEWHGILAAMEAVRARFVTVPPADETHARRELARCRRGRDFLDAYYQPAKSF